SSRCCSIVPIAPSSTRTRCPISSRKARAISLKFCIRRPECPPDCLVVVVSKVVTPCGSAGRSIPLGVTANREHPILPTFSRRIEPMRVQFVKCLGNGRLLGWAPVSPGGQLLCLATASPTENGRPDDQLPAVPPFSSTAPIHP